MSGLLLDLRHSARLLLRTPLFTLLACLSIAVGIGATTAVLTLVDAVVLRPLPVPAPGRLVAVGEVHELRDGGRSVEGSFGWERYRDHAALAGDAFTGLAAHHYREMSLRGTEESRPVMAVVASENYFDVLELRPALGRFFHAAEDPAERASEVVLGHRFWQAALGGDPGVLARTLVLDGHRYTVIGVAPEGFGGIYVAISTDVYVPVSVFRRNHPATEDRTEVWAEQLWLSVFGRLGEGVTPEAGAARLGSVASGWEAQPSWGNAAQVVRGVELIPLRPLPEWLRGATVGFTGTILLSAALTLLIAASNVAAMLLARATARRREMAIRLALCANRGRVARQLLTESLLLFVVGGSFGILLAAEGTSLLARALPGMVQGLPVAVELSPGLPVLAVAVALMLVTGVAFGMAPALQATRPDLLPGLKDSHRPGPLGRTSRLRGGLVAAQLALSLVLVLVAGLFFRAAQRGATIDPGFDTEGLVVASLNVAQHGYDEARGRLFYSELLDRLRSEPGVQAAALAQFPHLSGNVSTLLLGVPGSEAGPVPTSYSLVSSDWFETVGTDILYGRSFRASGDPAEGIVVNETLARAHWGGASAVGRVVTVDGVARTVVGVARDARYENLTKPAPPHLYLPLEARYAAAVTVHARASDDPAMALLGIRRAVRAVDPDMALRQPGTFEGRLDLLLLPQRMASALIGLLGLFGLVLAATGMFGVLSFHVEQQRREIALRVALGGKAADVMRMVLVRAGVLVGTGVVVGVAVSILLGRLVAGFLYGVSPLDPVVLVLGPLVLAAVGVMASWVPARRALSVDPMTLLRTE